MELRREPPSRSAPKGLRLHREQDIREKMMYDGIWDARKLKIESEIYPSRLARRGK